MRGVMPYFGEIFVCVFIYEIIKIFFKWNYDNGAPMQSTIIPEQDYNIIEQKNDKNEITIVYSFMIFKICEGLDIKVQLAPTEQRDAWVKKIKQSTKCIPIVRSEIIFKICNALNLPAKLELTERLDIQVEAQTKISSDIKTPPFVNSVAVYKICLALGLSAQLNDEV
ncbi:hypothetical protein NPIL_590081 [Nephila pilipes]|uniref:Uncharacterized protein n=1 Tax=Nephila pilipes TaxID=299642 RepID=A0A8X6U0C2_NEPPI|nr:hypothetical protein NPIL_590081 [Nephila pilipes]